jgi:hypothetical protein
MRRLSTGFLNAAFAVARVYKPVDKRLRDDGLESLHPGLGSVLLGVEKLANVVV